MTILVIAEHDGRDLRPCTRSALAFANQVAQQTSASIHCLVIGHHVADVARKASRMAHVVVADDGGLVQTVADRYAEVIVAAVKACQADLVVAATTTFSRDIVGRAAGLLGGAMASNVAGHEWRDGELLLRRPMYAGSVTATVRLHGAPQVVLIQASSYEPQEPAETEFEVTQLAVDTAELPPRMRVESEQIHESHRPDATEARMIVSGGRAFRSTADFERLVGGLADVLGAAVGSSRALVDAGITSNDLQIGQTGKQVAPQLYVALGISGAVQHLAGMKNSQVIVAINNDQHAPMFDVADYGLVADVYEIVPELIEMFDAE
ncbi:MAG: electron transfer flavoprotein subunit alpha/FixB family protein [Planctomycetaceae bacterium]